MGKQHEVQRTYKAVACKVTKRAIESHAADIRFYGMGDAFVCDIIRSMAAKGYVNIMEIK
jgi:hypothetical protein